MFGLQSVEGGILGWQQILKLRDESQWTTSDIGKLTIDLRCSFAIDSNDSLLIVAEVIMISL